MMLSREVFSIFLLSSCNSSSAQRATLITEPSLLTKGNSVPEAFVHSVVDVTDANSPGLVDMPDQGSPYTSRIAAFLRNRFALSSLRGTTVVINDNDIVEAVVDTESTTVAVATTEPCHRAFARHMTITEEVELLFRSRESNMRSFLRHMAPFNALIAGLLTRSVMVGDFAAHHSLKNGAVVLSMAHVLYIAYLTRSLQPPGVSWLDSQSPRLRQVVDLLAQGALLALYLSMQLSK